MVVLYNKTIKHFIAYSKRKNTRFLIITVLYILQTILVKKFLFLMLRSFF